MSDQPDAETPTYTTHNTYKRQIFMPPAGFKPVIPSKGPAADPRLRPHGQRHDPINNMIFLSIHLRAVNILFGIMD